VIETAEGGGEFRLASGHRPRARSLDNDILMRIDAADKRNALEKRAL